MISRRHKWFQKRLLGTIVLIWKLAIERITGELNGYGRKRSNFLENDTFLHFSAFLQFPVNVTRMSHSECGKLSRVSIYSFSPQKFIFHSIYFHYQYRGKLVIRDYENSKNLNAGGEQLVRGPGHWLMRTNCYNNNSHKNIKFNLNHT